MRTPDVGDACGRTLRDEVKLDVQGVLLVPSKETAIAMVSSGADSGRAAFSLLRSFTIVKGRPEPIESR